MPPTNVMAAEDTATENDPVANLTGRAMRLLAAREHSVEELRRKLRHCRSRDRAGRRVRNTVDGDTLEAVLGALQRGGLLSDVRFAEAFVHSRIERGQGPAKIRAGLRERGVAGELVDDALDFEPDFWRERAGRGARETLWGGPARGSRRLGEAGAIPCGTRLCRRDRVSNAGRAARIIRAPLPT